MEDKNGLQELLKRLDQFNRKQANYAKWQCIFSVVSAACCIGLFALVQTLMPQVRELTVQTETVLTNLKIVTDQLAEMDLGRMVENVDTLVTTSQTGLEQALRKLNAIDFDTLNQAIKDLAAVVEPLANFFNRFS